MGKDKGTVEIDAFQHNPMYVYVRSSTVITGAYIEENMRGIHSSFNLIFSSLFILQSLRAFDLASLLSIKGC